MNVPITEDDIRRLDVIIGLRDTSEYQHIVGEEWYQCKNNSDTFLLFDTSEDRLIVKIYFDGKCEQTVIEKPHVDDIRNTIIRIRRSHKIKSLLWH